MSREKISRISRKQMKKSHKPKRSLLTKFLLALSIIVLFLVIISAFFVISVIKDAPTFSASDLESPLSTRVYDQDDELVSTLFREENRIKVSIDDIPEQLQDAFISIEDKRFHNHHGIDVFRIAGAATANLKHGWGVEGGSTLSQQLIKRTILTPDKTLKRKIQEAWLALRLEQNYSKDEILEMYLNNVYFGHGAYGIQMASVHYFNEEDLSELNLAQIALLAGLPNAPSAGNPFNNPVQAKKRMNQVLDAMVKNEVISEAEAKEASGTELEDILQEPEKKDKDPFNAYLDAVYHELVKKEEVVSEQDFYQGGLEIYTHLDKDAQQMIDDLLHSDDIPYPDEHFETGISLVDTQTGVMKAIGGGRNFTSIQDINYGAFVKSQPGSTIKPILDYGPAIEHLKWSTAQPITDEPYQYSDGTPINNWDNKYWGSMTIRRALEWSRNIPALKAFQEVGSEQAQIFAEGLGIEIDPIYEAAALGGFDGASPLDLASAYAAFGNGGMYNEPSTVRKIVFPNGKEWEPEQKPHQAMQDYTAYMITDMLKTVITSGTGADANIPGIPIAGKTGSTNIPKEIREQYGINSGLLDSWFVGYTTEYSLAVWSGYPSLKAKNSDEIQYIQSDGTQHIPKILFKEIMTELSDENTLDFEQPDSVVSNGTELYVRGMEQQKRPEPQPEQPREIEEEDQEEPEEDLEKNEEDEIVEEEPDDKEGDGKDQDNEEENKEENDQNKDEEKKKEPNDDEKDQEAEKEKQDKEQKGTEEKKENDPADSS
ncbi:PBP1A family penicillin-binding protein [Pseudogracilibacillus sp. SE30717A]|uniref:transglycosylase domain-containing protein n=1 Tax=Pseudogracilibacillus sp. SE30717A TaxID=3098293 RepID=UPI00300E0A9C